MGKRNDAAHYYDDARDTYVDFSDDDDHIERSRNQDGRRTRRERHHRQVPKKTENAWASKIYGTLTGTTHQPRKPQRTSKRCTSRRRDSPKRKGKHARSNRLVQLFWFALICFCISAYAPRARHLLTRSSQKLHRGHESVKRPTDDTSLSESGNSNNKVVQSPRLTEKGLLEEPEGKSLDTGGMSAEGAQTHDNNNSRQKQTSKRVDAQQVPSGYQPDHHKNTDAQERNSEKESKNKQTRDEITQSKSRSDVPMSRKAVDLQVPESLGRADESTVKKYYKKLARAYLATFTQGIYRHMFFDVLRRRTYALTPPGANKGVQSMMFQIIDNKVYMMDPYEVPKNSKPFYRKRINEVIWLLSRLATKGRLKNTEFMVSIHDCVQTVNKPHTYRGATYQESIPAFTIVSCNFSDNIPFPMWEGDRSRGGGFAGWDAQMQEYSTKSQQPWSKKEPRAVFRGGNRPSMFFRNKTDAQAQCDRVGRTRLSYLAETNPSELDVSVGGSCGGTHRYLQRMDEITQQKFKYIVYAEGNCFWADRLNKQVFGPSLILKQETPCGQFWEPLLKPMTHYVPTDFYFDDLVEKIKWAREHDSKVQSIVRNANEFANSFLSLKGIEIYTEVLLAEYTTLLVEPNVKLERGAIDVTDSKV